MTAKLLDADFQFVKYGKYHHNPINKLIHIVFVPTLLFTAMVLVTKVQGPVWQYSHIAPINGALGVTLLYGLYYIILWPLIGVLYAPFLCAMCYYANVFAAQTSWPVTPFVAAASIHVVSWVFQIVGHQLFEGRAPAFTSDPIQALVLAPFFVFCEVLFDLGLFKKTRKRLEVKVVKAIRLMDHPKKA